MSSDFKTISPLNYSKKIELHTDLNIDECFNKLDDNIGPEDFVKLDYCEVRGDLNGDSFRIHQGYGRGSWRVEFVGELLPLREGTQIVGEFKIPGLVEPSMSSMLILLIIIAVLDLLHKSIRSY